MLSTCVQIMKHYIGNYSLIQNKMEHPKIDNSEKLATYGTQDEDKQYKNTT